MLCIDGYCLHFSFNAVGGGRVSDFAVKKYYEDLRFNVISVTRGWEAVECPEKSVT